MPGMGAGQVGSFDMKQIPVAVSQQLEPPEVAGQLFSQSASVVHGFTHTPPLLELLELLEEALPGPLVLPAPPPPPIPPSKS